MQDVQRNLPVQQRVAHGLQMLISDNVPGDERLKADEKAGVLHEEHRLEGRDQKELLVPVSLLHHRQRHVDRQREGQRALQKRRVRAGSGFLQVRSRSGQAKGE